MVLNFEYQSTAGNGHSPQIVHLPDNQLRAIYIDDDGNACGRWSDPVYGLYDSLEWKDVGIMSRDENVSLPSLKKVAHKGVYGFWSAAGNHKFVVYQLPMDVSETLINGSISVQKTTPVTQTSLTLQNIKNLLLKENGRCNVMPEAKLELYCSFGDSKELPMGCYYIDTAKTKVPGNEISVSARNTIGKLLKDQSFDEDRQFHGSVQDAFKSMLDTATVVDYFVGDPGVGWDLEFEYETSYADGIQDILKIFPGWKLEETMNGTVGIAPETDARFDQPSTYVFERDRTCFEYDLEYADDDVYGKVCVRRKEPFAYTYRKINSNRLWQSPAHRTLYVDVPSGVTDLQINQYADELLWAIERGGSKGTYASIFVPHMVVGDEVQMQNEDGSTENLGTVTEIKHSFGRSGFFTQFTVDSSGRKGRPILSDFITRLSTEPKSAAIVQGGE